MPYKFRGKYYGQVRHEGQKHRSEKLYDTKREALDWEAQKREELQNKKPAIPTGMEFKTASNEYLDYAKLHYIGKTYHEKSQACAMFLAVNGNMALDDILPDHVYKSMLKAHELVSANRANKDRKNLCAFFAWLIKYKHFHTNPALICDEFEHTPKPQYTPPPKDIMKIIAAATREERLFLMCYLQTGARKSEVFRLKWAEDISFTTGKMRLGTMKIGQKKKRKMEYRFLPMTDQLQKELKWWNENRPFRDSEYVFVVPEGRYAGHPYTYRHKFLKGLCKRAKISQNFEFHALRRYFATTMVNEKGQPMKVAQRFLGHGNLQTTERYVGKINEDLRYFAEMMVFPEEGSEEVENEA